MFWKKLIKLKKFLANLLYFVCNINDILSIYKNVNKKIIIPECAKFLH